MAVSSWFFFFCFLFFRFLFLFLEWSLLKSVAFEPWNSSRLMFDVARDWRLSFLSSSYKSSRRCWATQILRWHLFPLLLHVPPLLNRRHQHAHTTVESKSHQLSRRNQNININKTSTESSPIIRQFDHFPVSANLSVNFVKLLLNILRVYFLYKNYIIFLCKIFIILLYKNYMIKHY